MCNPRRVLVYVTRTVRAAWQKQVAQYVTASGEISEQAQITAEVGLAEEMGDEALLMFERVLAGEFPGFEPWTRDEAGCYCYDFPGVSVVYHPDSRQLVLVGRVIELIQVQARGEAVARGEVVRDVMVLQGSWDNVSTQLPGLKQSFMMDEIGAEQNRAAVQDATDEAWAIAREKAEVELKARQAEARKGLRAKLEAAFAGAEEPIYAVINRAVGEAYRQTLLQLVLANGGRVLQDEENGAVINLELELY